ncbi:MAG TPA: hypothetical protein VF412_12660 [Bdellovibrio sp.]|uniref:hypothetical protein n=1 Tax=Bdellovibrio sp. TaxID=28201 RepID=UPI002EE8AF43
MEEILNNLLWIEDLLPHDIQSLPKHGGVAYYLDMNLVLILVEQSDSTYEYKGVTYPFQLWNGAIIPIKYARQSAFFLKYLFLENHPANKDWLYIPAESENFEEEIRQLLREINKRNPLLGVPMKVPTALPREKAPSKEGPRKKVAKAAKKVKGDKKRENNFLLGIANRQRK